MSDAVKAKLGLNVFKEDKQFHIRIRAGHERDPRLKLAVTLCPAGLYQAEDDGSVSLGQDGCLECGTCLVVCSDEVLEWNYPTGGAGVQYRFG